MGISLFISGTSLAKPSCVDQNTHPDLIPLPKHFTVNEGSVEFTEYSKIVTDLPPEYQFIAEQVRKHFREILHTPLRVEGSQTLHEFKLPRKFRDFPIAVGDQKQFALEGYYLWVDQDGVCLQAPSPRGIFYATRTLFQLLFESEGKFCVQRCEIIDYPTLEIRGVIDENARGQAGSVEGIKHYIRIISDFKINMFQMNLEDMFLSRMHPKTSDGERGCFSKEEIQEIVQFARQYFIEVCPIQSTCGHMENLFFLPEYRSLSEFPHAGTCFDISSNETISYLTDLIQEEVEAWSESNHFHIACDGTYDVGEGCSRDYVLEMGGKERRIWNISLKFSIS